MKINANETEGDDFSKYEYIADGKFTEREVYEYMFRRKI